MDGLFGTVDEKLVHGVNWAPDSCDEEEEDQQESPVPEKLVRGVNWAPDSCVEEEEDQQEIAPAEEDDADVFHALMQLASTEFEFRLIDHCNSLLNLI
ncbi:unnamed protein product [Miscanthus lutarioriparius]|uniref:Uncharacterized protein n=1 Tax=Miscanthus lutarioriparius TaxID=422564 RepID=A0A811QH63_9POAL|nr:unnamed protein product [Miscanthus lutarioriparius]